MLYDPLGGAARDAAQAACPSELTQFWQTPASVRPMVSAAVVFADCRVEEVMPRDTFSVGRMGWPTILLACCLGCLPSNGSRLVGRWDGQPQSSPSALSAAASAGRAGGGVTDVQTDVSAVRLSLHCEATRFTMTLHQPDGSSNRRSGHWTVLESRGSRWLVEFAPEDATDPVRMWVVFRDADQFTAREVAGDDRVSAWGFRRLPAAGSEHEAAEPTEGQN
jgi:hypothetical protein